MTLQNRGESKWIIKHGNHGRIFGSGGLLWQDRSQNDGIAPPVSSSIWKISEQMQDAIFAWEDFSTKLPTSCSSLVVYQPTPQNWPDDQV